MPFSEKSLKRSPKEKMLNLLKWIVFVIVLCDRWALWVRIRVFFEGWGNWRVECSEKCEVAEVRERLKVVTCGGSERV